MKKTFISFLILLGYGVVCRAQTTGNPSPNVNTVVTNPGGGNGLPAGGLVGQSVVNTAPGMGSFQSSAVPICNGGAVIVTTPYTLLADSGTATRDRSSLCVVNTAGAGTFHVLAGSTSGVGTGFTFGFVNDGAGTWTVDNNAGSDTFNVENGSALSDAQTSFTVTTGQFFSVTNSGVSNGSGGVIWYVRLNPGGAVGALIQVPPLTSTNTIAPTVNNVIGLSVISSTGGQAGYDFRVCTTSACSTVDFGVYSGGGGGADVTGTLQVSGPIRGLNTTADLTFSGGQDTNQAVRDAGGLFRGSHNASALSGAVSGFGILTGGLLTAATPNAAALEGVVQVGSGFLKGTAVANLGDVVCGTTTAFTVTDCSHTGPQVNIVGIATSTANPIGVINSGQALVKTDGAVTLGDILCMGTTTDGLAHDNGTAVCATAGTTIGIVIATSGTIETLNGSTITGTAMSTTLPLVELHLGK